MSSDQDAAAPLTSSAAHATRSGSLVSSTVVMLQSPSPAPPQKRKRSSFDIKSLQAASFPQGQAPSNVYRIGFVGAGNMARAIAEGMIASGMVDTLCSADNEALYTTWLRVIIMFMMFDHTRSSESQQYHIFSHQYYIRESEKDEGIIL